jgi:RNA polymerase sigma-70 factor (ECF subfamily)
MAQQIDTDLVNAARAGDARALNQLLADLSRIFRAFFLNRIGPRDEVEDLVQNSLLRVSTGIADLNDPTRLKAFAMKAAFFELQDLYRGRYRAKETLFDPLDATDTVEPEDAGDRVDLERALDHLSEHARRILELREYGYRYEEIAERMNTTEAAVKMQVKRAFEKLRDVLAGLLLLLLLK